MKNIKIMLEYQCFPIWIYNNGLVEDTCMPNELKKYKDLENEFVEIQKIYDSLFLDTTIEFDYIGFKNGASKQAFIEKLETASTKLENVAKGLFNVERSYKIDDL